jgi:hypothetical protein
MKMGIVIIVYNLPTDMFLLQIEAIERFCKDKDYTIEIFDNSSIHLMSHNIKYHAELIGLSYTRTMASSENSSDSHAFSANFAYQKLKDKYDGFFFMDHDLYPVRDFSVEEILKGNVIAAGLGQGAKKTYFWPGCVMFNNTIIDKNIIDFSPNSEYGLDTGGNFYRLIEEYGKENCIFFNESYHQNPYFVDARYGHYAMINNEMFLHCVNASNWAENQRHEERMNTLKNIITEFINKEDAETA